MEINLVLTQKSKITARITVGGAVINSVHELLISP